MLIDKKSSGLSSRERVLAASSSQPVDYVPCAPFLNFADWPQRVGKRWQYPFGPTEQESLRYVVGELRLDQIVSYSWGFFPADQVTSEVWGEGDTIHKKYTTPSGELHASIRYNDRWPHGFDIPFFSDYNPAHYIEPWITNHDDVECLRHIFLPPHSKDQLRRIRFLFRQKKELAARYELANCFCSGMGLTGALQMFGPTQLCIAALDEPGLVDNYLEIDHGLNLQNFDIALDLGADMVRRNGFYECCKFFSPEMLERFLGARLSREIAMVHEAGRLIGYTLHSGIMPVLDFLSQLDFDCLFFPDVFLQGADGGEMAAKLGRKMAFWTGPSDTIHMPWGEPDSVREAVRSVFEIFGRQGLVITPCSGTRAVFPWDNVLAMIDEWKVLREGK